MQPDKRNVDKNLQEPQVIENNILELIIYEPQGVINNDIGELILYEPQVIDNNIPELILRKPQEVINFDRSIIDSTPHEMLIGCKIIGVTSDGA